MSRFGRQCNKKYSAAENVGSIADFCQRWHIIEFALFGSILRDDFRADSDIDVLVTFAPDFQRSFTDTIQMREELETLFGRKVDFLVKAAIARSDNLVFKYSI